MGLVTVFFPRPVTKLGYAKAIVDEKSQDFFVDMGAFLTAEEALKQKPAPAPEPSFDDIENELEDPDLDEGMSNPDRGWGKPGSHQYHVGMIKTAETPEEVINYTFELTGRRVLNRGSLRDIKRNALKRVKEFMTDDNDQG